MRLSTAIIFIAVFIISTISGLSAFSCPVECICSPNGIAQSEDDWSFGQLWDVTCDWPQIPGANIFTTFPHKSIYRLTIQCKNGFPRSRFVPSMFSSFTALHHLAMINCHSEDSGLPSGLLHGLTKLKTLHLDNISMPGSKLHLDIGALVGSPALERLTLIHSNLVDIPGNLMCHFKDLKLLNLSNNDIRDMKSIGYFGNGDCDNQLVILDLTHNRITQLNKNAFKNMDHLHILRLGGNSIHQIDIDTFESLPRLQELYVDGNNLTKIEELPTAIQILDLSDNQLRTLPPNMHLYQNLVQLNFSGNLLFEDSQSSILYLGSHLTILDLSRNKLQRLSGDLFQNTTYLQQLYLRQNRLEKLQSNVFMSMPRLRYLDLSNNYLQQLSKEHLNGLQNLTELILDNNGLSTIADDAFSVTPQLRQLSLASNAISQAPTALTLLYFLQRLDMSKNSINMIPKFLFDKLPNLKELGLASNQIRSIDRYVLEKLPILTVLDLSSNRIEQLAMNCFEGTTAIKVLRLDGNAITDIQGHFLGLPQLQTLNLSSNRIAFIDFAMLPVGLRTLHAANNSITHVSNVLLQHQRRPPQLSILDLSTNKIKQLNGDMLPNSIEIANFSGNNIVKVDDSTTLDKGNLSYLDLSFNQLIEVPLDSVRTKVPSNSYKLSLIGNPLQCTCNNEWIQTVSRISDNTGPKIRLFEITSAPILINAKELSCAPVWPPDQESIPFKDVKPEEFQCEYDVRCTDDCMCCEFDSCDCKSVCPDGCRCFYNNKHQVNVIRCQKDFQTSALNLRRKIPMHASKIDLSQTEIEELQSSSFFARFKLKQLYLNNTGIKIISNNAFNGLTALEMLDLSSNNLAELSGMEFHNLPKLHRLLLNDNRLQSIPELLFERLSALRELALHNNRFTILPNAIVTYSPMLSSLTLSGNPWKCDCDPNRYVLQKWLPENTVVVRDYKTIYCADSILSDGRVGHSSTLNSTNSSSALSILPPPVVTIGQTVIKVNFWTFINGINITFCLPITVGNDHAIKMTSDPATPETEFATTRSTMDTGLDNKVMLICVAIAAVILILVIIFIAWRFQDFWRCRYSKYSTTGGTGSVNSSTRTTATTPIPLLQYDAFVSYCAEEQTFVTDQITNRLEQEYPYYNLCLLYRDVLTNCIDCHRIDDKIIANMERSQRIITVLTRNFLEKEWNSLQLRTAYQYLMRDKQRKPIIVIVVDEIPQDTEPSLGHYLRRSRCLHWADPMFWQKFMEAMPERSIQQQESATLTHSTNYSDIYGTIVPSRFV